MGYPYCVKTFIFENIEGSYIVAGKVADLKRCQRIHYPGQAWPIKHISFIQHTHLGSHLAVDEMVKDANHIFDIHRHELAYF